ncbi:DNA polymerase III subunit beta [Streptomyces xanthochromogenes]|uniref:DNA polymerase III subunit beta n=1 Tax=Streptomyces xanthochromogenes TaxID=67384 RepID=UPI0037F826C3
MMKLTLDNDVLADAVQFAFRAIPARPPVPVLAGILLAATKDGLTASGFDYYVSTRATEAADIDKAGRVLVSGRLLADIVRALPKQPVVLSEEGTDLVVTCGRARFTLPTLPLKDYPALPKMPPASGTAAGDALADLATRVAAATAHDASVPVLGGVQIEFDETRLTMTATDRYRFSVAEMEWTPDPKTDAASGKVLVPAETLRDAAKVLAGSTQATLAFTDNMLAISTADRQITGGLIEGELPKYKSLVPTEFATVATAATGELAAIVKRVALVLGKGDPLFLEISDGEITVRAGTHDTGMGLDCMDASLNGEPITAAFNPQLLADTLQAIDAPTVQLNFTTPVKPALFHAPDQAATFRSILMPVRTTETTPKE